jgi:L-lactate dehydrogenase (cytochrome)
MVFDYVDGGAGAEVTLRANRAAFERPQFDPRWLTDVSERQTATTVLGERVSMPILLAPTGLSRLSHVQAELDGARAAGAAGTIFSVSTSSSYAIEEITDVATGPVWFQLYLWRDDAAVRALVERVAAAGCSALILTIDVPVVGNRERDLRNGATLPPKLSLRNAADVGRHPRWLCNLARRPRVWYGSLPNGVRPEVGIGDPSATWDRVDWLRRLWDGPLIIKGVLSARDAHEAVRRGADAVYVSNHGGRQLDNCPATLDVLPEVVDAVGGRAEVFVDGGVRRGEDAVRARALGAQAALIGRPWVFALAAGGARGVERMLEVLRADVDRTLGLLGVPRIDDIDAGVLRRPPLPAAAEPAEPMRL